MEAIDIRVHGLQVLRDITVRLNIVYSVVQYDAEEEVHILRELVEQKKRQYLASDKIVIYCRTVDQVKDFAKALDYIVF